MTVNLSHRIDMAVGENSIKTDSHQHGQPHYSKDSHPAGKALELVDKCTRCSFQSNRSSYGCVTQEVIDRLVTNSNFC